LSSYPYNRMIFNGFLDSLVKRLPLDFGLATRPSCPFLAQIALFPLSVSVISDAVRNMGYPVRNVDRGNVHVKQRHIEW
jgi:hypothetical protein